MPDSTHFDLIIIGTGLGGGTLAHHLAPTGKRILLLERGDWLPREKQNWDSRAVFMEHRYQAKETWYDQAGNEFHPGIHYYVGGNSKFYGAALLRLRKEDFGVLRHHDGNLPRLAGGLPGLRALLHRRRAPVSRTRRTWRGPHRAPGERRLSLPARTPRAPHTADP